MLMNQIVLILVDLDEYLDFSRDFLDLSRSVKEENYSETMYFYKNLDLSNKNYVKYFNR